jgi:hypothetical protein
MPPYLPPAARCDFLDHLRQRVRPCKTHHCLSWTLKVRRKSQLSKSLCPTRPHRDWLALSLLNSLNTRLEPELTDL